MLNTIFLDLDDTLLDFHRAEAAALSKTLEQLGIPPTAETVARWMSAALEVDTVVDGEDVYVVSGGVLPLERQRELSGAFLFVLAKKKCPRTPKEKSAFAGALEPYAGGDFVRGHP